MKHYLVEHWAYKDSWFRLSEEERKNFVAGICQAVEAMADVGIRTLGFGRVDHELDRANRSFDFWSLWEMESVEARDAFLIGVASTGWYDYFEHANTGGVLEEPSEFLKSHVVAQQD